MTMRLPPTTTAALLAATLMAFSTAAVAVTERVKRDCKPDYDRYCSAYAVGSEGLRACMSRSAKKLSKTCVSALVDAGEMTKGQADRLRKSSSSKTAKASSKKTSAKRTSSKRTSSKRTTSKRSSSRKRTSSAPKGSWNPFSH